MNVGQHPRLSLLCLPFALTASFIATDVSTTLWLDESESLLSFYILDITYSTDNCAATAVAARAYDGEYHTEALEVPRIDVSDCVLFFPSGSFSEMYF